MLVIQLLFITTALVLLIPVTVLSIQVLSAYLPKYQALSIESTHIKIVVLIPAHDEEAGISKTISSILPQLKSIDRLIVVADNCTDNTAKISQEMGAEVVIRQDVDNRGKGYALHFGIQFVALEPPDVIIIIDADCQVQDQTISKIAGYSIHYNKPVQCLYLMLTNPHSGLKAKIAEFAWIVRNQVRPLGFANLQLPCQLMGTGMAFPWTVLSKVSLANGHIVEDMKLGIDLANLGVTPLFYADALVTSYFPTTADAQTVQRTRWEHGQLGMILSYALPLFVNSIRKLDKNMLAMALDLCVPPLALLILLLSGSFFISVIAYMLNITSWAIVISLISLLLMCTAILLAWWGWARNIISVTSFLYIPFYIFFKIPHYLKFLLKRQTKWIRTDRK